MTNEIPSRSTFTVEDNTASGHARVHYGDTYSNNSFNINYNLPTPEASSEVQDRINIGEAVVALNALATAVHRRFLQIETTSESHRSSVTEGAAQILDFKNLMQNFCDSHNTISQNEALPLLTLLMNAVDLFDRFYTAFPINISADQDISSLNELIPRIREQNVALREYQSLVTCESEAASHRRQSIVERITNTFLVENRLLQHRVDDLQRQLDATAQASISKETPAPSLSIQRSELNTKDWYIRSKSPKVVETHHTPYEGPTEQKLKAMLRSCSDGELREEEIVLRRQMVKARLLVVKSSICAPLTFGVSLVRTAWGGHQWHASSSKLSFVYEELEARGLLTRKDELLWTLWTEMYHSGARVNTFPIPKLFSQSE